MLMQLLLFAVFVSNGLHTARGATMRARGCTACRHQQMHLRANLRVRHIATELTNATVKHGYRRKSDQLLQAGDLEDGKSHRRAK